MNAEFMEALNAIEKERGISKDILIDAFESALIAAYKRNYGTTGNVRAVVDRDTGEVQIFASKTVVEQVENIHAEISLEKARAINPLYEVGDVLEEEANPRNFGRIAAQTAKQVVVQRIREAERGVIFDEYVEKENEILTAIVQRVEKGGVYVELGKTDGLIAMNETIPGEEYNNNDRIKVYVLEVRKTNKGPQVLVSRTHPGLVKRLFELEVPEIHSGVVEVKSIAREAGNRNCAGEIHCARGGFPHESCGVFFRSAGGCGWGMRWPARHPRRAHCKRTAQREDRHHRMGQRPGRLYRKGTESGEGDHGLHQRI